MKHYPYLLFPFLFLFACTETPIPPDEKGCITKTDEQVVIDELNQGLALSFDSPTPSAADPQLDPLIDYLGEAHFVGMGESTHGTAEFYAMKDKIFRQLVIKKDFKAIVFEIPWGNAMVVNDFVVNGLGSAEEAVDQTWYWTYDTEEVRVLAQWIHDYNLDKEADEKIYFVGNDPQGGNFFQEKRIVQEYLERVAPDSVLGIMKNYVSLPSSNLFEYPSSPSNVHKANQEGNQAVLDYFGQNKTPFVSQTSELEYQIALMAAHVIQQREKLYRIGDSGVPRDSLMAVYSEWWQRILAPDAKVAIWAHNGHVMDGAAHNIQWMGTFLRHRHGDDYRKVAFSFGTGTFNAFVAGVTGSFQAPVRLQRVDEPPCGSINYVLNQVEGDRHYLLLGQLTGESKTYFLEVQPFLQLGAGFNENFINSYVRRYRIGRMADVLIHFDETSASILR